jgi:DNA polymerase-3 subunit gamma/tau
VATRPISSGALALSPAVAPVTAIAAAPAAPPDLDTWRSILERIRANQPALASVLEHAVVLEIGPTRVSIGFAPGSSFLAARASEEAAQEALARAARDYFGGGGDRHALGKDGMSSDIPTPKVVVERSSQVAPLRTVASVDAERRSAERARARARVEDHPLVREAVRIFGAQVRDVKLPNDEA